MPAAAKAHEQTETRAVLPALIVAVVAISFAAIFFKKAEPTHPLVASAVRLAIAGLILSPLTIRALIDGHLRGRTLKAALLAGVCYAVHFGTWVSSLTLTSIAASVTLVTTTPILLGVLALATGRDRPGSRFWIALPLALIGLAIIGGGSPEIFGDAMLGNALALLGALAMAAYMTIVRGLGNNLPLWPFAGMATAVASVLLLGTGLAAGVEIKVASSEAFIYLVLAAVLPQLVGHNLLTWSLRHLPPYAVGMAVVAEPVGAAILGWIWLGEPVGLLVGLGCGITLAAIILAVSDRKRTHATPLP